MKWIFQMHKWDAFPYCGVFFGVVFWDGDVVVGHFGFICCFFFGVPHNVVQVWEVMIQVDSFKAVSSLSPSRQFWTLHHINKYNVGIIKENIYIY